MVVDGPNGDRESNVGVSNDQEMDQGENENADFGKLQIICLYLNLLKVYTQIFVTICRID